MFPSDQQYIQLASLCPTLGKKYAEIHSGICPSSLQAPFGHTLPVSFIGTHPYIKYKPIGGRGSDFLVLKIFSDKFTFRSAFQPARNFAAMTDQVWTCLLLNNKKFKLPPTDFGQAKWNRNRSKKFFGFLWQTCCFAMDVCVRVFNRAEKANSNCIIWNFNSSIWHQCLGLFHWMHHHNFCTLDCDAKALVNSFWRSKPTWLYFSRWFYP